MRHEISRQVVYRLIYNIELKININFIVHLKIACDIVLSKIIKTYDLYPNHEKFIITGYKVILFIYFFLVM